MGSAGFLITYFAAGIFGYVDSLVQLYWSLFNNSLEMS